MSKILKKTKEMAENFLITRYKIVEGYMKEFMEANDISEADFKLHGSAHEYMQQHTTNILYKGKVILAYQSDIQKGLMMREIWKED